MMREVAQAPAGPPVVAVVIPYYQRAPGLLRAAVTSVARQIDCPAVQVIVVDDGSPHPAEDDLRDIDPAIRSQLLLVRQPNRGVAVARNTGLDRVADSVAWIAFLDADDTWCHSHLSTAIAALERGYDLFFADNRRIGDPHTLFELSGLAIAAHRVIDPARAIHEFSTDLFTTVLRFSPVITSTVVYRHAGYASLRFHETYRTYEDSLFWLRFAGTRIAFSTELHTVLGEGVNISKRPDDWRSNRALEILRDIDGMYRLIGMEFSLTPAQAGLLRGLRARNRLAVARTATAMLRRRMAPDYAVVRAVLGSAPAVLALCARVTALDVARRVAARLGRTPLANMS